MTASNPLLRIASASAAILAGATKYGENLLLKATGKDRSEIDQELRQAKSVGQFTVLMATVKAKQALEGLTSKDSEPPTRAGESEPVTEQQDVGSHTEIPAPVCIADYDSLTASQIVAQLVELSAEERASVLAYEEANRARNSILKEISRLS